MKPCKLKWQYIKTQYVGGDTYVAKGHPDLQIIGRYTDDNSQYYLLMLKGQVLEKSFDLKYLQNYVVKNDLGGLL